MNQNTRLEIIPFNSNNIFCPVINGEPYVILNSIIEEIGLSYKAARENLNNGRFSKYMATLSIKLGDKSENQSTERWIVFEKNGEKQEFFDRIDTQWVPILKEIKGYNYAVLPVRKLPAWLYSLDISKVKEEVRPVLEKFQDECDDILFNHFFGPMAQRKNILLDSYTDRLRIDELKKQLKEDDRYKELTELMKRSNTLSNEMKRIDRDVVAQQQTLFDIDKD